MSTLTLEIAGFLLRKRFRHPKKSPHGHRVMGKYDQDSLVEPLPPINKCSRVEYLYMSVGVMKEMKLRDLPSLFISRRIKKTKAEDKNCHTTTMMSIKTDTDLKLLNI